MANRSDLLLQWVSNGAAKSACKAWHYSGSFPACRSACVGVWESGQFIGAVVFGHGGNYRAGAPYGLRIGDVVELTRVALNSHTTPVSRIVAISLRMLRASSPGVRLVVSYADPAAGHVGGIYKAGGWVYVGQTPAGYEFRLHGRRLQKRSYTGLNYGQPKWKVPTGAERVATPGKHKYLMPMDPETRTRLSALAVPYPKAPVEHEHAPTDQVGDGGPIRPAGSNP